MSETLSEYLAETADAPVETPEETPAVAETVETPSEPDPVQEYVAKYGGDTEAALRAAVEAQSLIGRQGNELGSVRQELQQLREALTPQEQVSPFPNEQEAQTWAEQIGYAENWRDGAQWALQNNSPLYERIMEGAYATDPKGAARFEMIQAQQFAMSQMQPAIAPLIADQHRSQFINAWNDLKPAFDDIDQLAPAMMETAKQSPELAFALQNGDRESQRKVISNLYWIAKGQAAAPLATVTQVAAQNAAQESQQLRQAAAVGTATASAPAPPPLTETPAISEWRSALNEELDNLSGRVIEVS